MKRQLPFYAQLKVGALLLALLLVGKVGAQVQFVHTSDPHYGITRTKFRQTANVNATVVNAAMIAKMNNLSALSFPNDGGVKQGTIVGGIDYVVMTGDIANRQETPIQSASGSWAQFKTDYIDGITLKNKAGQKTSLLLIPGNHDVTNAIGFYKSMSPLKDSASMVNIYSLMMPTTRTAGNYNYENEKIHYSKNIGGIHMMFVCIWPDSAERKWMEADLANVNASTPVFIFTHDQPSVESKHFTNPNGNHSINSTDKFENNLLERLKDGTKKTTDASTIEQRGFASFVKMHPNILVYFHGNDHQSKYYTYTGPDNNISISVIDADSPMKGIVSGTSASNGIGDETKLSFQLVSIDTLAKKLTVRECLWNTDTINNNTPIVFGASTTISLVVDSMKIKANALIESDYTIPSWTLFLRAYNSYLTGNTSTTLANLGAAIKNLVPKCKPYNVNMTINGDPTSRLGFTWFTNQGIADGLIQLVEGDVDSTKFTNPLIFKATSSNLDNVNYNVSKNQLFSLAGMTDNTLKSYVCHKGIATALKPNTTYSYRVGANGSYSAVGKFTTAKNNKDPFTFMYFTDTQAQCDSMFDISQRTIHAAKNKIPNAKFALIAGDLVESYSNPNSEWEYEQWFETMQDVWNNTPLAPIMGNHDKVGSKNCSNHFNTLNPSFDTNMSTDPGSFYSFVYGNALFMALSYEDYNKTGMLDSAALWMNSQVKANPNTRWRIAFFHKTMFTGSADHQSDADSKIVREKMGPVFDSLHINLAIQGHDHVYEVIGPLNNTNRTLISNRITNQKIVAVDPNKNLTGKEGGTYDLNSGTLYFLNSSAGIKKYPPRNKSQMDAAEGAINMSNYWSLFTGKFGQTDSLKYGNTLNGGDPMFSAITVSTDSITINTYSVGKHTGIVSNFDAIKLVKLTSKAYKDALALDENNYTIPSWTTFKRVFTATPDDSVKLQVAINKLVSKNTPFNINMTINGNPSNRLGFTWYTNKDVSNGQVQLVEGDVDSTKFTNPILFDAIATSLNNVNYNVSKNQLSSLAGIADNTLKSYVSHKSIATGLKSNTTYSFRVGTKGSYSVVGKFTTAKDNKDPFTFIYFTDTQAQCDSMFDISQRTVHQAKATIPNAKFALVAGDLVETSATPNSEWEYEQWFETMQDVWNTTPLAPIMGNHDKVGSKNCSNHFNTLNPSFDTNLSTDPGSFYSFVYGDALFLALSYEDYNKAGMLDSTALWMNAQIKANPNTKWRIAFFHKTMFTGSADHQSDADSKIVREKMGPVFDSLKINLAIQGHDHVYEVIGPLNNTTRTLVPNRISEQTTVAVDAAKNLTGKLGGNFDVSDGTLYFLNSSAGIKKYPPRNKSQMDAIEAAINMTNYWSLFTGRFGQTDSLNYGNTLNGGNPMFSSISICSDSISVVTYSVGKHSGVISKFDAFKITAPIHVSSVLVSDKSKTIIVGSTATITATITPSNAANKAITWKSEDASIVSVVDGVVTAKKTGTVSIIVSSVDGSKTDTCKIIVTTKTGLNSNENQTNISIAPNPARDAAIVKADNNELINKVEILNNKGQLLFSKKTNDNKVELDLTRYSKGYYIVIIHTKNEVISKQLIIQ